MSGRFCLTPGAAIITTRRVSRQNSCRAPDLGSILGGRAHSPPLYLFMIRLFGWVVLLTLYRFKTRCMVSDQVFHEIGYAAR